jgi:hypothetical protein
MPAPKPQKVEIYFEDGSRVEEDFELLPTPLQRDLLRQPFAMRPSPHPEKEKFLLLEWEDGWKEVMQVDPACTEINRYYVISRPEDMGRLSLNREDGYPDLIEVIRKPLDLRRITFMDNFQLSPARSDEEGTKTDHFFEISKNGETFASEIAALKKLLADEKISLKDLQTQDSVRQRERFEEVRQFMGLRAGFRQQDVFDFIAFLVRSLSDYDS